MKVQEVLLRALSGALTWIQAAEILGIHTRSLRRRAGLYDQRRRLSRRKAWSGACSRSCGCTDTHTAPGDGHPEFNVQDLTAVLQRRRQLVDMLTAETNRLAIAARRLRPQIQARIEWLQ